MIASGFRPLTLKYSILITRKVCVFFIVGFTAKKVIPTYTFENTNINFLRALVTGEPKLLLIQICRQIQLDRKKVVS